MQVIQKTIRAKIHHLTKFKKWKISREYQNFQMALKGDDVELYSATKQQAERYVKKIKRNGGKVIHENHPMVIMRDLVKIERPPTKLSKFWARVPVFGKSIWVPIQLPYTQEDLLNEDIREAKLVKKKDKWFLHITVQKEILVEIPEDPSRIAVVSIDMGERNPATSVVLIGDKISKPMFNAKKVRGIRAHYTNLRKRIGRKKVKHGIGALRKIGNKEQRMVEYELHKASKEIVEQAKQLRKEGFEPVIVVGNLKRARKPRIKGKTRCKKINRKVHSMPSYKMRSFIDYKALWEEIPMVFQDESYTTMICHKCNSQNTIAYKRYFKCLDCSLECNRDFNAAINIGNRFLDQWFKNRVVLAQPLTPTESNAPKGDY